MTYKRSDIICLKRFFDEMDEDKSGGLTLDCKNEVYFSFRIREINFKIGSPPPYRS